VIVSERVQEDDGWLSTVAEEDTAWLERTSRSALDLIARAYDEAYKEVRAVVEQGVLPAAREAREDADGDGAEPPA
jgi:hypothetical protein